MAALVFHIVGTKWPQIKAKAGTRFDWVLWNKRIANAVRVLRVLLALALITIAFTAYYEIRRMQSPKSQNALPAPLTHPSQRVDWHDKQNWRHFLHTGMTKTEVRQLFGDPERMSIISNSEFWDYGTGEIDFVDGTLNSWYEPGK